MATKTRRAQLEFMHREAVTKGRYLEALIDACNEVIISADSLGMITTWNLAAERLYGYSKEEIIGSPVSVLCPADRVLEQQRLLEAAARGQVSSEFGTQRSHKNGSPLDVSVTISRIMEDDSLSGFCCVTHDIAERLRSRDRLEELVRDGAHALFRSRAETLRGLALAAEYRDYETARHTERVGESAARLAAGLDLPASLVRTIRDAAPLHDVGKIGIPDKILLNPGKLTTAEFEAIKQHTLLGSKLLAGSDGETLQLGEQIARTHHERWDGHGYPDGLPGETIPIAGRIVAVADAFDSMTHQRPYRSACTVDAALGELARCSGSQFDPRVIDAFLRLDHHTSQDERAPASDEPKTETRRVLIRGARPSLETPRRLRAKASAITAPQ